MGSIALNVGMHRFTFGVMVPALRSDLGLDYLASGTLNATHMAGYLAGTLVAPMIVRRTGARRLAFLGHMMVACGAAACALAPAGGPAYGVLAAGRLASGLGAGMALLCVMVIALGAVSAARRPTVSAIVWAGMGFAIIGSGLAIGGLLSPGIGWRAAFAATAALAFGLAVLMPASSVSPPEPPSAHPFGLSAMLTPRWIFFLVAYFMFGAGYIAYSTFAGARMAAAEASVAVTGAMWVAVGTASMIGAWLTILILNNPRLKPSAMVFGLALAAAGAALAISDLAVAALAGALMVGLGLSSTPSIASAIARERSSAEDYARAFSFATAALGSGQFIGPVAAGWLADLFGTGAAPAFAAAAYGIGAVAALIDRRIMRRAGG